MKEIYDVFFLVIHLEIRPIIKSTRKTESYHRLLKTGFVLFSIYEINGNSLFCRLHNGQEL